MCKNLCPFKQIFLPINTEDTAGIVNLIKKATGKKIDFDASSVEHYIERDFYKSGEITVELIDPNKLRETTIKIQ